MSLIGSVVFLCSILANDHANNHAVLRDAVLQLIFALQLNRCSENRVSSITE